MVCQCINKGYCEKMVTLGVIAIFLDKLVIQNVAYQK
jgi:hypothetical protein